MLIAACFDKKSVKMEQDQLRQWERPYELDWAGRFEDTHPSLVDFENPDDWVLEANGGSAKFERSREQFIWGKYSGKIVYSGTPDGADFIISPPQPIKIPEAFTAINIWVWNWHFQWAKDRNEPRAVLGVLLETVTGEAYEIPFPRELDWPEWYLLHVGLSGKQREAFSRGGIFKGLRLSNCKRSDELSVYFDNLSFYREEFPPLHFEVEPKPGIDLPEGQRLGVHTGSERLPFPTREETMLPVNLEEKFTTEFLQENNAFVFRYKGPDGTLEYRYRPQSGDFSDITTLWENGAVNKFYPMNEGGVRIAVDNNVEGLIDRYGAYITKEVKAVAPEKIELIESGVRGDNAFSRWKIYGKEQSAEVEYVFRLWQKSLIIDVYSSGGQIGEVSFGAAKGIQNPRLVHVPYWTGEDIGANKERPAVLVMGTADKPLFMTVFADHYRTGASRFYFQNKVEKEAAVCSGGTSYIPKTNGERNDCYERIFLTVSPRFEEILPTVDNPPSVWRDIASEYLVFNRGASMDREKDYEHWKLTARYGIRKLIVMDHEVGWRDGAESFTFRTIPAPGKGGNKGQKKYADRVRKLGMRYGIYNNYTDLIPVNEHWSEDLVVRLPDGSWETAWFRCYAPKSQKTVSMEPKITSEIQKKFNLNAGCLDVHTAITPWMRVDYDERVPGAGTLLSQFYDFGQLMLHQQQVWNGPTFSEGGNHYYYNGLITGSNGDDRGYNISDNPWLVDFDLLKLHPLGCDVGFVHDRQMVNDDSWDRFFAGTIAYGHLGKFLDYRDDMKPISLRSYYMLQQLQSSYAKALVKEILYADKNGNLMDISTAVATDVYRRSQLRIKYDNGLIIWVNGHNEDHWETPDAILPPNGYYAKDTKGKLIVFSALINGSRADYVHAPAYDYMDGRGKWLETPWGASDGKLIILKNKGEHSIEVIPFNTQQFAIVLDNPPVNVSALDIAGKKIGATTGSFRNGMYYPAIVAGAVSYVLELNK
jgi:hypothetical protein